MKDHPSIFSGPMIRALLAGWKSMTRRLAWRDKVLWKSGRFYRNEQIETAWTRVKPGDRLWVRENVKLISQGPGKQIGIFYAADPDPAEVHYFSPEAHKLKRIGITPCIHMPRWASRLTLVVTATKTEPLQSISLEDMLAEGCIESGRIFGATPTAFKMEEMRVRLAWRDLWIKLNGAGSWNANPEVVALTFAPHKINIDAMPKEIAA